MSLEPIDVYFFNHTINAAQAVYDKYAHLARLSGTSIRESFNKGISHIILKKDYRFHEMLQKTEFNFTQDFSSILDEIGKILEHYIDKNEVGISEDGSVMRVRGQEFDVSEFREFIPDQITIMEFLLLVVFAHRSVEVEKILEKAGDKFKDKKVFDVEEAAEFTGYTKSYIYKLHSERKIRGGQRKQGGKLSFKRSVLEDLMFRYNNTDL